LLLACKLPVDVIYEAYAKDGENAEIDTWLETSKRQAAIPGNTSQGQLRIKCRASLKMNFMSPGKDFDLPPQFQIGLAWEFMSKDKPVDLDASMVALDSSEKIVDQVWYNKLEGLNGAVVHSGDNQSGEGDGDDETITIDLTKMPDTVEKIAVCINSYNEEKLEECVEFVYLRLIVDGTTFGFYAAGEGWIPSCTGIFFGSIRKLPEKWIFRSTAAPANGATVEQSLPEILTYGKKHLGW